MIDFWGFWALVIPMWVIVGGTITFLVLRAEKRSDERIHNLVYGENEK